MTRKGPRDLYLLIFLHVEQVDSAGSNSSRIAKWQRPDDLLLLLSRRPRFQIAPPLAQPSEPVTLLRSRPRGKRADVARPFAAGAGMGQGIVRIEPKVVGFLWNG